MTEVDTTPEQDQEEQGTDEGESTTEDEGNGEEETVTVPKGEWEKTQKERDQARDMQSIADKEKRKALRKMKAMERAFNNVSQGEDGDTRGEVELEPYTDEEKTQISNQAEKGILSKVATNSKYREVLDNDPTLKDIISRNPLALIDNYIDAEDAVEQVLEVLDERAEQASNTAQEKSDSDGEGEQPSKKNIKSKGGGGGGSERTLTPEQASELSTKEYGQLPKEVRKQLMAGETVTLK